MLPSMQKINIIQSVNHNVLYFHRCFTKSMLLCLREVLISRPLRLKTCFVVLSSLSSMCHALISNHATKAVFTLFNMQITCKTSAPEWIKNSLELCVFVYIHFKTEDTARRCMIAVISWHRNQISNKCCLCSVWFSQNIGSFISSCSHWKHQSSTSLLKPH